MTANDGGGQALTATDGVRRLAGFFCNKMATVSHRKLPTAIIVLAMGENLTHPKSLKVLLSHVESSNALLSLFY